MADDLLPTSDATAQAVMATGVSAPPPAKKPDDITSLLPTKEQHEGAKAGLESAYKKHEEELGGMIREGDEAYKRDRARMEQAVKQEGATIEELKHGTWNAQKELSDRKVDIWEQFGSPGFIIAMLASSFSAMPMNSALNAGAAAMNAIQQGKMDEYRKAFDAWKANTDLVIQRQAMEHQVYEDINKLMTSDLARWREKFLVANARFGDERMRVLAENDMLPEIDQAFSAKATAISQVALAKDKIEESGMRTMFVNAQEGVWRDGPNGQKVPNPQAWQAAVDLWHNMGDAERSSYDKFVLETWQTTGASPTDEAIREHTRKQAEAKYPYRMVAATADIKAVKGDLESALGHPLNANLNAALDSAYSAKGATASRVVGSVNRAISEIERDLAAGKTEAEIDPEKKINEALLAGSMPGGRSAATAFINKYQLQHPEAGPDEINKAASLFTQTQSRARTLGTRGANVDTAVVEAKKTAKLALEASAKVPRGDWVPINELQRKILQGTSSPEQKVFDQFNTSLITAYAQTMSRTGGNTVEAMKRASDVLDTATGPEAYKKGAEALIIEMEVVQDAVREIPNVPETEAATSTTSAVKWIRRPDGSLGPAQ